MRAFFAFELPEEVIDELDRLTDELRNIIPRGIKWVRPEQMHITLKFLGDIAPQDIRELDIAAAEILADQSEFEIYEPRIQAIPSRNPRVIWVHYQTDEKRVLSLPGKIRSIAGGMGYDLDNKPLKLHATLGRVKSSVDMEQVARMLSYKPKITKANINQITLYKSVLQPEGPVYTAISSYDLQRRNHG